MAAALMAGLPFAPDDFPPPTLTDALELSLPSPVCFDNGDTSECLENGWMIPSTPVLNTYHYLGPEQQDAYSVNFYADLYESGVFQQSLTLSGSIDMVDERTSPTL